MLSTLLVTFVAFALAFFGLAIGWLVAEKRLKGSCGGLNGGGCGVSRLAEGRVGTSARLRRSRLRGIDGG